MKVFPILKKLILGLILISITHLREDHSESLGLAQNTQLCLSCKEM